MCRGRPSRRLARPRPEGRGHGGRLRRRGRGGRSGAAAPGLWEKEDTCPAAEGHEPGRARPRACLCQTWALTTTDGHEKRAYKTECKLWSLIKNFPAILMVFVWHVGSSGSGSGVEEAPCGVNVSSNRS